MSRIYEALQKADRDRSADSLSDVDRMDGTRDIPHLGPAPIGPTIVFEQIVPQSWKVASASLPALADHGVVVEEFRSLRSRLYQARYDGRLKTVLISSGSPSEGKSFVSMNLAMSLARNRASKVLLIDGDLRRSTLHKFLGAPNSIGLSDYLSGTTDLEVILQRGDTLSCSSGPGGAALANLAFIAAGTPSSNSSELFANHRFEELIAAVSPYFDWIIIDSPPVLAVTDAVELAHTVDSVLLVARVGSTKFGAAQRTQALFSSARILGFVLNDAKKSRSQSSPYDYYYYSGLDSEGDQSSRKARRRKP